MDKASNNNRQDTHFLFNNRQDTHFLFNNRQDTHFLFNNRQDTHFLFNNRQDTHFLFSRHSYSEIDYVPVIEAIEFQSGESEKEVSIELVNDKHAEQDETFQLYLTGTNGVILSPYPQTSVAITNEDHGKVNL